MTTTTTHVSSTIDNHSNVLDRHLHQHPILEAIYWFGTTYYLWRHLFRLLHHRAAAAAASRRHDDLALFSQSQPFHYTVHRFVFVLDKGIERYCQSFIIITGTTTIITITIAIVIGRKRYHRRLLYCFFSATADVQGRLLLLDLLSILSQRNK